MEEIGTVSPVWASALGSILVVVVSYLLSRRKTRAEISQISVDTALELLGPLREQIKDLTNRVHCLEQQREEDHQELARLRNGVTVLSDQVVELGEAPRWPPELRSGGRFRWP